MVALVMTVLFLGIPVVLFLVTRSATRTALSISIVFAIAGGLLQASVGLGMSWTLQSLQLLVVSCLLVALAWGLWSVRSSGRSTANLPHQVWAVWAPALTVGLIFLAMRLLASPDPGPLAGVGYLVSHAAAEDNAKWLNLAAQMTSGDPVTFAGGYAGGPFLLVLAVSATSMTALSQLILGGVNEVAVVTGTVIGSGFLLAALVPFALAPLAEKQWRPNHDAPRRPIPPPLMWIATIVLVAASVAVSGIGHQSLQLVMLMLTLWVTTLLTGGVIPRGRFIATVMVAAVGVVWFPMNLWSIALLIAVMIWVISAVLRDSRIPRGRPWGPLLMLVIAVVAYWDGLISSALYALGLDGRSNMSAMGVLGATLTRIPRDTASLFSSPGGTEETTAYLALTAAATAIAAGVWLSKKRLTRRQLALAFSPLGSLVAYSGFIAFGDAFLTGSGTNYATLKMIFLVTVVILASTAPLALMSLDPSAPAMTGLRWVGVGALGFILIVDSLLPRALASVGPLQWKAPAEESPPYWTTFEVRNTAEQPLSTLPIACVFLPPGADKPAGNIDGQLTYSCTRLLIGLNGAEGNVGSLMDWIGTDWLSNGTYWDDWYGTLKDAPQDVKDKQVILLNEKSEVIGFDTFGGLLNRFPPPEPQS